MASSIRLVQARQVAEQHERLVKVILFGVRPPQLRIAAVMNGAEHVVVSEDVGITQFFRVLRPFADDRRVVPDLLVWKHDADLHLHLPVCFQARK